MILTMKKIVSALFALMLVLRVTADEGMWLPLLLKSLNEKDMKKNGLKLSAEDIYSVNKSSLKDAIVHFGGGCTAEIISESGLMITNHHCGYSAIQSHSSVENDYLSNGFWAMSKEQEKPNQGLTASIIQYMEDVTAKVKTGITASMSEQQADSVIRSNIAKLEKEAVKGTHYEAYIRPFFYGNEYYMFVVETFKDVRLVGAPPSSIGKFGGETDNWVWPRHTGDFSLFRIYANKDNKPAEYSADNVPYKPKKFLTISLKGVNEGVTMVYGFPGRTQEYLTSDAVDMVMNESDPARVKLRDARLKIMDSYMKTSDKTRIDYAAKYASIANYWKKWAGEMAGLQVSDAVNKKKEFQEKFIKLLATDPAKQQEFVKVLNEFQQIYADMKILNKQMDYYSECLMGVEGMQYMRGYTSLFDSYSLMKMGRPNSFQKSLDNYKKNEKNFYKAYHAEMDKKICAEMLKQFDADMEKNFRPRVLDSLITAYNKDYNKLAEVLHASKFFNADELRKLVGDFEGNYKNFEKDLYLRLYRDILDYYGGKVQPKMEEYNLRLNTLYGKYVKALKETVKDRPFYPDANSTLRVTYGKVNGYVPRDGVKFNYFTTLDGILEKQNTGIDDFKAPAKLKELYEKKDYGQYADKKDGKIHVAFVASNHTTGGNSGSPVLNGNGELIGTNFDRCWEGTMSDIMYNPNICRNIVLDVRYTLFVIDKFAGAGYLLNEMKIVK
jgi:hypothetical protein